eukprot:scaffold51711_cov66-Attheya_sp.AAC.3
MRPKPPPSRGITINDEGRIPDSQFEQDEGCIPMLEEVFVPLETSTAIWEDALDGLGFEVS